MAVDSFWQYNGPEMIYFSFTYGFYSYNIWEQFIYLWHSCLCVYVYLLMCVHLCLLVCVLLFLVFLHHWNLGVVWIYCLKFLFGVFHVSISVGLIVMNGYSGSKCSVVGCGSLACSGMHVITGCWICISVLMMLMVLKRVLCLCVWGGCGVCCGNMFCLMLLSRNCEV